MGGCGPVVVMGEPGLISGEARPLGPAPTLPVRPPWMHISATASIRGGISSPSGGCPMGAALCGQPVGHSFRIPPAIRQNDRNKPLDAVVTIA